MAAGAPSQGLKRGLGIEEKRFNFLWPFLHHIFDCSVLISVSVCLVDNSAWYTPSLSFRIGLLASGSVASGGIALLYHMPHACSLQPLSQPTWSIVKCRWCLHVKLVPSHVLPPTLLCQCSSSFHFCLLKPYMPCSDIPTENMPTSFFTIHNPNSPDVNAKVDAKVEISERKFVENKVEISAPRVGINIRRCPFVHRTEQMFESRM